MIPPFNFIKGCREWNKIGNLFGNISTVLVDITSLNPSTVLVACDEFWPLEVPFISGIHLYSILSPSSTLWLVIRTCQWAIFGHVGRATPGVWGGMVTGVLLHLLLPVVVLMSEREINYCLV